jgi:hypothetical protein
MSGDSTTNSNPGFFWDDRRFEPKRTFRWKVRFDNLVPHIPPQYVISVQKPNFGFSVESISDLGTPKYKKGALELRPIEIVCIDDEQNTVSNWIHYYYNLAGLKFSRRSQIGNTTSKTLTEKTRNIEISMLNELGNVIEQYVLYNGWISDVKHSPLNYTDAGFATYAMTIVYDNYEYLVSPESGKILNFGTDEPNVKQISSSVGTVNPLIEHISKLVKIHGPASHSHNNSAATTQTPAPTASDSSTATQTPAPRSASPKNRKIDAPPKP